MRINIDIDDELIRQAMLINGTKTKREIVEASLRLLVEASLQTGIRRLKGKARW